MTELSQSLAILRKGCLGSVTKTHQRFFASLLASARKNVIDLGGRHGPRIGIAGILSEGAITAPITAQIGDRKKDFPGIGDRSSFVFIAQSRRGVEQGFERGACGINQVVCLW